MKLDLARLLGFRIAGGTAATSAKIGNKEGVKPSRPASA
jgi:hypothetical protein